MHTDDFGIGFENALDRFLQLHIFKNIKSYSYENLIMGNFFKRFKKSTATQRKITIQKSYPVYHP